MLKLTEEQKQNRKLNKVEYIKILEGLLKAGINQQVVADKLGVSEQYITNLKGKRGSVADKQLNELKALLKG
jgi:hypothetical protein